MGRGRSASTKERTGESANGRASAAFLPQVRSAGTILAAGVCPLLTRATTMPLTLRMIGSDDYTVHDDRQLVGRIRYPSERSPGFWLWTCVVTLPGPPSGEARSLEEA